MLSMRPKSNLRCLHDHNIAIDGLRVNLSKVGTLKVDSGIQERKRGICGIKVGE